MRTTTPMTLADVARVAPAVLTNEAGPCMMPGYKHVSSWKILEALLDSGYGISRAQQIEGRGRHKLSKFAKHIVCLRPLEAFGELVRGQYIHELVYTASHDGSTAVHISHGLFRVICGNGMMTGEANWKAFRMKHVEGAEQAAINAAKALVLEGPAVEGMVQRMQMREMSPDEQRELARRALPLRFEEQASAYDPGVLLMQRRLEDAGNDLWRVLNRIQENITKGGFESAPGPKGRTVRLPEITRIGSDVSINQGVWDLAESFLA